jgi:replicative DNA helicase
MLDEMIVLHREGQLSQDTLIASLKARGNLDAMGKEFSDVGKTGEAYIRYAFGQATPNPDHFIKMLEMEVTRKNGMSIAQLLFVELQQKVRDPRELVEEGMRRMENAIKMRHSGGVSIGQLMGGLGTRMDAQRNGTFIPAYKWKIAPYLEQYIPHLDNEDLIVFATRPGQGKSSVMRAEFGASAIRDGEPSVIFNLENSEIQYAIYVLAMITGIDAYNLQDARKLNYEQLEIARREIKRLQNSPLQILTMSAPAAIEIVGEIATLYKAGFKNFGIDYLQLVRNGMSKSSDDISCTSQTVRGAAMKVHRPIHAIAQLNREVEHRGGNPVLSDLSGSGSLEQDATQVVFIWAAWEGEPTQEMIMSYPENFNYPRSGIIRAVPIRFHVAKNRNGGIGDTPPFLWDRATNRFRLIQR